MTRQFVIQVEADVPSGNLRSMTNYLQTILQDAGAAGVVTVNKVVTGSIQDIIEDVHAMRDQIEAVS
jgi:hypothetical protein